nr:hypothetical protein [Loktanella fryxellensis]
MEGCSGKDSIADGAGNDTRSGGIGNDSNGGGLGDDTLNGGDGGDWLFGGGGSNQLDGDADADTLGGADGIDRLSVGDGDDSIADGAGDDTLAGRVGGAGGDMLTTGRGFDQVLPDRANGSDPVTDFDIGAALANGSFNGQLVINALRNGTGNPVTIADVVVTADGNGWAVLTCPEGESVTRSDVPARPMPTGPQLSGPVSRALRTAR